MKPFYLLLILLLITSTLTQAQTFSDVFDKKTGITWFGLDFTATKIIGDKESWAEKDPKEMVKAWNQLMITEREKYDVAKPLRKDSVKFAIDVTMEHNSSLDIKDILADTSTPNLSREDLELIIKSYDFKGNSGIGLMFIIERFDKRAGEGTMWVAFLNIDTKQILYVERKVSKAGGFGLRNYWASCVYDVMKKMKSMDYNKWYKKYHTSEKK